MSPSPCVGCLGSMECWVCSGSGCHKCRHTGTCHVCSAVLVLPVVPEQRAAPVVACVRGSGRVHASVNAGARALCGVGPVIVHLPEAFRADDPAACEPCVLAAAPAQPLVAP